MNKPVAIVLGIIIGGLLLLFSTTYSVKYNEVAIRATFGQVHEGSIVANPGLHWRLPVFIDKVSKLDTRLQFIESPLEEITTSDGLQVVVRGFMLWKVRGETESDPLAFFQAYKSIEGANRALEGQFRTAFTGHLSKFAFDELIGQDSKLAVAEEEIRQAMIASLSDDGVLPVLVGINQLSLPPRTSQAVLERMKATRDVLARSENSKGTAEANRIRAKASTQADKIRAFASQRAEEIRAMGEIQSARYLEEMSADEELAIFLVWLDALETALSDHTTVVLPTTVEPWHILNPPGSGSGMNGAIPHPPGRGD